MPFMAWLLWSKNEKDPIQGPRFSIYRLISRSLRLTAFKTCETMADMTSNIPDLPADSEEQRLQACLIAFAAGDAESKDELISHACHQMQQMAHRMLGRFPNVRRWDDTGDVVQNSAMRLSKTLDAVKPIDVRSFMGLAALHIRRELLDLARKYAGPESYAANHETNFHQNDGEFRAKIDDAADPTNSSDRIERWSAVHIAAEGLPEEEREVFHIMWYLGMKQEDAAHMLDCSLRTIKRRWNSAKSLIRKQVAGETGG